MVFCTIFHQFRYIPIPLQVLVEYLVRQMLRHKVGNLKMFVSCLTILWCPGRIHNQKWLVEFLGRSFQNILMQNHPKSDHVSIPLDWKPKHRSNDQFWYSLKNNFRISPSPHFYSNFTFIMVYPHPNFNLTLIYPHPDLPLFLPYYLKSFTWNIESFWDFSSWQIWGWFKETSNHPHSFSSYNCSKILSTVIHC